MAMLALPATLPPGAIPVLEEIARGVYRIEARPRDLAAARSRAWSLVETVARRARIAVDAARDDDLKGCRPVLAALAANAVEALAAIDAANGVREGTPE